ncbi:MAG: aldolase [Kiloniellaceae bacterium]
MNEPLREARNDLAAALRLAARFGLHEGICNHFSTAAPDAADRFLINPYGVHWSQVRARDVLLVNGDGEVIEGDGEVEASAFCIHSQVHLRHPGARCVLHTHMPYATALTAVEGGRLEPVHQNSLRFYGDVAYDESYNGPANEREEGARIAAALGAKRVLFLANHGVIVVGPSVAKAFSDLYYLERACQVQVLAMSTGRPLKRVGDNLAAGAFDQRRGADDPYARAHFAALKRLLDGEDPGYAA